MAVPDTVCPDCAVGAPAGGVSAAQASGVCHERLTRCRYRRCRQGGCLACQFGKRLSRDRVTRHVRDEPDLLQSEVGAPQQVVRIGHPGAVLEAEVHVDRLGGDEREVARTASVDGDVVSDQPPSGPNALDRIGDGLANHDSQPLREIPNLVGVPGQEQVGGIGSGGTMFSWPQSAAPTASGAPSGFDSSDRAGTFQRAAAATIAVAAAPIGGHRGDQVERVDERNLGHGDERRRRSRPGATARSRSRRQGCRAPHRRPPPASRKGASRRAPVRYTAVPRLPRIAIPSAPPSSPLVSEIPVAAPACSGGALPTMSSVASVMTGRQPERNDDRGNRDEQQAAVAVDGRGR